MINLYPLKEFQFPVVAECISPNVFGGKRREEMLKLEVWEGNKQKMLSELFKIEHVEGESTAITIYGDVSKVRKIGACMTSGEIVIKGNAGMHLGEEMRGGKITAHGNVGSWAGSMMKGGEIEIHGNTGDYLGAPYRGSSIGINGGHITVYGNAGSEAGTYMKKGTIKIYGSAGQFAGFRMHAGTLYVQDNCGDRAGACMIEGKVVVGGFLDSVLPTFTIDSVKAKVKIEEGETAEGMFYTFLGDLAENGRGKLYVSKDKNPHLSRYEKYL